MNSYTDKATKGLDYLDTYVPHWFDHVELDTLCMRSTQNCVVGQVFPAEWFSDSVLAMLAYVHPGDDPLDVCEGEPYQWAVEYGFDNVSDTADGWWTRAVIARRNGRK